MFQTLQPQTFRINKTALPGKRRNINLTLNIQDRPFTMDVERHLSLKTAKQNIFKTIDDAEIELTYSFRHQMSPYIHQKIRNSLSRNNQRRLFFSRASSYLDNPEQEFESNSKILQNQKMQTSKSPLSINLNHLKFSTIINRDIKSPFRQKELIFQSIVTNTKQKIDRIIGLKNQKEQQYQELKQSIEKKCLKLNKNPFRKISVLNPTGSLKPPTIETLEWDKEWKQEVKKESNRYRNRLISKHKRQMSMKIQLTDSMFKIE